MNDFRNNSEPSKNLFESFKDASEKEIEPQDSSGDLNEDQFEAEWA